MQSAESSDEESSRSLLTVQILDSDGEVIAVHHCEWTVGSDDTPIVLTGRDSDILEVWVGDKSRDLDQNFVPPSERGIIGQVVNATLLDDQWEDMSDDDDDISFPDSNSFDSYNHKNSFSPDNTNYDDNEDEEEQEVR